MIGRPVAAEAEAKADEIVVDALVNGYRVNGPNQAERRLAIQALFRRRPDWVAREIADHVGVNIRTVDRVRARMKEASHAGN